MIGIVMAARRGFLEKYSIYDKCILGAGDSVLLYGMMKEIEFDKHPLHQFNRWHQVLILLNAFAFVLLM
jgi:hypothetical protein